jgi:putative transposase
MAPKASAHAVYKLKYHFVSGPKYRKDPLAGEVAKATQEIIPSVLEAFDMESDTMEVMEDHVYVFLSPPPRYSPDRIIQIMKSAFTRGILAQFPRLRRKLCGAEFWDDGYFVRSTGDQVTSEIIRRYLRYQKSPQIHTIEAVG